MRLGSARKFWAKLLQESAGGSSLRILSDWACSARTISVQHLVALMFPLWW